MARLFLSSSFIFLLTAIPLLSAQAQLVQPGEYKCWKAADLAAESGTNPSVTNPTAGSVSDDMGICRYQARPNDNVYRDLLALAQSYLPHYVPGVGFNPKDRHPQRGMGQRTIEWWYTTPGWNESLGEVLKLNDRPFFIQQGAQVRIELTMYTFERGFEKELGFDFAGFYGKREVEQELPKYSHSLSKGLFNAALGLGNPLASYLTMGIEASVGRRRAEEIVQEAIPCTVGGDCHITTGKSNNYYSAPSSIEIKTDELGLIVHTVPQMNPEDPTTIMLRDLSVKYAIPTGNLTAPVETHQIRDGLDLVLKTGETYVIGNKMTNRDLKTGKLLSSGTERAFTHFLVLIRVTAGQEDRNQIPAALKATSDLSYSPAEKEDLRKSVSQIGLKDFFDSLELVCFNDYINPGSRKICGFRFNKISENLIGQRLKFSINGKLKYAEKKNQFLRAGDVYSGKGYYQLPLMDDTKPADYSVTVELDGPLSREKSRAEGLKGIKFDFRYYPDSTHDPVEFSPSSVRRLK